MLFLTCFGSSDWSQFFPDIVATTIGVALPLLIGLFSSLYQKSKKSKELILEFEKELQYNKKSLNDWNTTKVLPASSIKLLKTTVYELALSTGDLALINNQTRKDIAEVYELSVFFNNCLQEQTKCYFDKDNLNEDIQEKMDLLKIQIIEIIDCIDFS